MMALAKAAQSRGSFSAAVNARAGVSRLRSELARLREEREAETEDDPLTRVQRLRRLATEAGSYTAAGSLAKLEAELLQAREDAQRGASDGMEEMSPDEIIGVVEAAILSLPDPLVQRIAEACADRLSGKKLRLLSGQ